MQLSVWKYYIQKYALLKYNVSVMHMWKYAKVYLFFDKGFAFQKFQRDLVSLCRTPYWNL